MPHMPRGSLLKINWEHRPQRSLLDAQPSWMRLDQLRTGRPLVGAKREQGCAGQSFHASQRPSLFLDKEAGRDLGEEFEQSDK